MNLSMIKGELLKATTSPKCLILGDKQTGKSSFINRLTSGDFSDVYTPSILPIIQQVSLNTNIGNVNFQVYEGGCPDSIDCALVMFDLNNRDSFNKVIEYYDFVVQTFGNIPIIILGNKCDSVMDYQESTHPNTVKITEITNFIHNTYKHLNLVYFDISAKSLYNYDKPFLYLLRKLINGNDKTYMELMNSSVLVY